jgi:hypothetical protein
VRATVQNDLSCVKVTAVADHNRSLIARVANPWERATVGKLTL